LPDDGLTLLRSGIKSRSRHAGVEPMIDKAYPLPW